MQSPDVFLFPLTGCHYFSTIEIKQKHFVVPANLQVVRIQVGVAHAHLMKAMQLSTEVTPEFLVARPLRYAICE
jgi:hypothetical protein